MKSKYPDKKQLEQLVRSTKTDFTPPEGLLNKVKAALAAAPEPGSVPRSLPWLPRKLVYAFAIVVALAFGAGIFKWHAENQAILTVIAARPPVTDGKSHALQIGDRLPAGCNITTGEEGRINLITRGGSELTLNSNSKLALAKNGKEAILSRGRLYCRNRAHEFAAILTPAGRIELLGTIVDAAIKDQQTVAVTVVEGKVRLENTHGQAVVNTGKKSLLSAQLPPEVGEAVDTTAETAWHAGKGKNGSDFDQIAYTVYRGTLLNEVWAMNTDGTGKHRIKSYIGPWIRRGNLLPGGRVLLCQSDVPNISWPDFETRQIDQRHGRSMTGSFLSWRIWLVDAASEQDTPLYIPVDCSLGDYQAMSPDGQSIAFFYLREGFTAHGEIWIYNFRTKNIKKVIKRDAITSLSWSADGKDLVASVAGDNNNNNLLAPAAGSRFGSKFGVSPSDNILSPEEEAQTERALAELQEAIFQYAVGKARVYEGKPAESKAAFQAASKMFTKLPWKYPLVRFSTYDVMYYADMAAQAASMPENIVIAEACKARLETLYEIIYLYVKLHKQQIPDIATAVKWLTGEYATRLKGHPFTIGAWLPMPVDQVETIGLVSTCPLGDSYIYNLPPAGEQPKEGDVLASCPNHPQYRIVWKDLGKGGMRPTLLTNESGKD